MTERTGLVTFKGGPLTLTGYGDIAVGDRLPSVTLSKSLLEDVNLSSYRGKKVILNVVPSIDTGICQIQTKRFNEEAASLGADVVILTISADLPVAQSRWCGASDVTAVVMLSDYKYGEFGAASGLKIKELGLLARAVYVVNREGVVTYAELVKEVASEPAYDGALAAVKSIA
jgi:thioredoxin-dependent peroxiredoxin